MKHELPAPEQATDTPKKRYEKPRLRRFGTVAQLTLGGSGTVAEGMSGMLGKF